MTYNTTYSIYAHHLSDEIYQANKDGWYILQGRPIKNGKISLTAVHIGSNVYLSLSEQEKVIEDIKRKILR